MDKEKLFHKKFGFYLNNLLFIQNDTTCHIEYYTNYNKIDLYQYDITNKIWTFIRDGVKDLELNI